MKKSILSFFLILLVSPLFSQVLPRVGILPFTVSTENPGSTAAEANQVTNAIAAELSSWGVMTVLTGAEAESAEYIVRGETGRIDGRVVLIATTSDGRSGREFNTSRSEGATLGAISMEAFGEQISIHIPVPNFLLGTWQSVINMADGPVITILEFRFDRTVRVHRYDTWEHDGTNIIKYQAIGSGTYTYAGYRRRAVNLEGRTIQTDATVGISLELEDALPAFEIINALGLRVLFDEARENFDLVYGSLPCGTNYSGPAVYPTERVVYTRFVKIN
ncbi:MAG: hypothetical protein FWH12_05465 [Treponema sp.]|nr:hypothetical protein [Treponema sp.]